MRDLSQQCGDALGQGAFRITYAKRGTTTRVIKRAKPNQQFHNWIEWFVWNTAPADVRAGLAKVWSISPCGYYLEMERVDPWCGSQRELPHAARMVVMDQSENNFGVTLRAPHRTVFHDYALVTLPGWNPTVAIAPPTAGDIAMESSRYGTTSIKRARQYTWRGYNGQ